MPSRRRHEGRSESPDSAASDASSSDEGRSWRKERDSRKEGVSHAATAKPRSAGDDDRQRPRRRESPGRRRSPEARKTSPEKAEPRRSPERTLRREEKSSKHHRRSLSRDRAKGHDRREASPRRKRSSTSRDRHRTDRNRSSSTERRRAHKDSRRGRSRERSVSRERRRQRSDSREHRSRRRDRSSSGGRHRKHSRSRSRRRSLSRDGGREPAGKARDRKKGERLEGSRSKAEAGRSQSESSGDTESSAGERETVEERAKKAAMNRGEREKYEEFLRNEELRRKEEKKRMKQLMKERETPEQKRARRLAKKEAKERRRKQEMGWDEEYAGYTNHDNPFGDPNLLHTFKWKKKLEKEGIKDIKDEELERMNRRKREEQRQELEKVKERRLERERERAERDAAIEMEQRQREGAQFEQWAAQEDSFHLQQAKLRSKIRIEDGRAKPIDLLARYISAEEEDFSLDMIEPYLYLNGLTLDDFEDLIEDINVYMRLESKKNQEYWNDIRIIVDEEVRKLNNEDKNVQDERAGRSAISSEVSSEIVNVFKGKTPKQLEVLKSQIEQKLGNKAPGLDVAYWETLLSRLRSYMARARLRERHEENLRKKLEQLKLEQGMAEEERTAARNAAIEAAEAGASASPQENPVEEEEPAHPEREELDPLQQSIEEYETGRYTPVLVSVSDLEPGVLLTDPDEDEQRREARKQLLRTGGTTKLTRLEEEFEREARKGMDSEEARFSVEEQLVDSQSYQWSDKWRPRKPRYFNRVHTGFEWNKYNQTHYDIDNPPPKIVQGYKFNIFYPDLIDKNKTPQYFLIPCKDNQDFSILRFHAGPPYEDIAFKVVNREWEYSYKKGFRCQFHNDIFQLWFHFKRYRYRR